MTTWTDRSKSTTSTWQKYEGVSRLLCEDASHLLFEDSAYILLNRFSQWNKDRKTTNVTWR